MESTNNLIELDYTHETCSKNLPTIWEIENNEKQMFIEYIDNIISTKFEKKITEQNETIKQLIEENKTNIEIDNIISTKFEKKITEQNETIKQLVEENKKFKETLNNLFFDLANYNVFHVSKCNALNKYQYNILESNREIELEYIDYDFVVSELEQFYSKLLQPNVYIRNNHVEKDISNNKEFVKKMYIKPNNISNINFKNKIFRTSGPNIFSAYFQNFIKSMTIRREYFQHDSGNGFRLFIWINDSEDEKRITQEYSNINLNFIPNAKFKKV